MPVSVRKLNGKYRVVEAGSDKLATRNGRPIDGGGFSSKERALRQVGAVNSSLAERAERKK